MPKPRVTLDTGPAVHQRAGLSRYTERLATTLAECHADDIDLQLFYNRHSGHQLPDALQSQRVYTLPMGQYAWRLSVLGSQMARTPYAPLLPIVGRDGIYHATEHLLPCLPQATVLTVHDLIFERYPQHHTATNRAFLRVAMPRFVAAARHLIAVSQHTARDLVELYRVPRSKISVIHEGIDASFQPAPLDEQAAIRARYSPIRPYLLMLGTLEPRKNHLLALQALARIKALGLPHRLVIAGGAGWLFEPIQAQIRRLALEDDVVFAGYVPQADLAALYSAAACLLMPSLYEGFGFPVLEAMACGTPVIASRAASLPELGGDAALYVPTDDPDALAAAIHLIASQPALVEAMRQAGLARARAFTWTASARQTVELYRALATSER